MWMEITSAGLGAEEPNSTNGVVKSLNVHRNSTSTSTWLTGRSDRMVIFLICCQIPAPSMAEASYRSGAMPCSPAITHRNANGQLRQIEMMTSAKKLLCPISQNDGRLVMPSTLCRRSFTSPLLYWNMKDQMITEA